MLGDELTKHQQAAGRIGGQSRSEAKRTAVQANLIKARAARWKPKPTGIQSNVLGSPNGGNNEQERIPQTSSEDGGSVRCCVSSASGSG